MNLLGKTSDRLLPLHVLNVGRFGGYHHQPLFDAAGWSNVANPVGNLAYYFQMFIPGYFTVARFFVANGNNLTGNIDIGLYDGDFNRLVSTGPSARSGASAMQYVDATDYQGAPGEYHLGVVLDNTTGTLNVSTSSFWSTLQLTGMTNEALASGTLPAKGRPAGLLSNYVPLCGFTQSATL